MGSVYTAKLALARGRVGAGVGSYVRCREKRNLRGCRICHRNPYNCGLA